MKIDTVFVLHHLEHEPDEDKGPDGVTHIIAAVGESGGAGRDHLENKPVLCTVSVHSTYVLHLERSEDILDLLGLVILD